MGYRTDGKFPSAKWSTHGVESLHVHWPNTLPRYSTLGRCKVPVHKGIKPFPNGICQWRKNGCRIRWKTTAAIRVWPVGCPIRWWVFSECHETMRLWWINLMNCTFNLALCCFLMKSHFAAPFQCHWTHQPVCVPAQTCNSSSYIHLWLNDPVNLCERKRCFGLKGIK